MIIERLAKMLHRHKWQTSAHNKWFIATRQVCHCGLERQFEYPLPAEPIDIQMNRRIDVRWTHGYWVRSDGVFEEFKEQFD